MRLAPIVLLTACWTSSSPAPIEHTSPPPADAAVAAAPGSAKVIQRTQAGGVIQLEGDRPVAMEDAMKAMNDHCGPERFMIVQEGEEAIGADPGGPTVVAWRVHYQCVLDNP